jgi:hypothetical protein
VTEDICRIFNVPIKVISGGATEAEYKSAIKLAVAPVLRTIESALNRDFLLESEKRGYFYRFDTAELLKSDAKDRYDALKTAIDSKLMTVDEARAFENLPPFGINFVLFNQGDVVYYPDRDVFYVPNSDTTYSPKDGTIGPVEPESPEPPKRDFDGEEQREDAQSA